MGLVALVLRLVKGVPLSNQEVDDNFTNLNNGIARVAADFYSETDPALDPTITVVAGNTWANATSGYLERRNAGNTAWVQEKRLYRASLDQIPEAEIPTVAGLPIYVPGVGIMEWNPDLGVYVAKAGGATGGGADQLFWVNGTTMTADWTVKTGEGQGHFGRLVVPDGLNLTVEDGGSLIIV